MADEKKQEVQEMKLNIDLPDIITETYTKAYLAYRISLENWFLLNEMLAFMKNEKLSPKEVQNRLQRLFSVANTEIIKELVRLNQIALAKASAVKEGLEQSEEKNKNG